MGLGGILQELKTEGVLALYHDYRSGRLVDYSGNGRNGAITNGYFTKDGALLRPASGQIAILYDAGIVANAISIVMGLYLPVITAGDRLLTRRDGGGSTIDWYINPPSITNYQNVGNRSINIPTVPIKSLGISMSNGVVAEGYTNGVAQGPYAGLTDLFPTLNNIVIGNLVGASCLTNKVVKYVCYITRALTATEHARVYAQLENMTWNTKGLTPGPMMP
jgi:peptidoglycan hydrolase-like protein with peptidoglycan-binding domain